MTTRQKTVTGIFAVLSVILICAIGFLLYKISLLNQEITAAKSSPAAFAQSENQNMMRKLGDLVILPTDEEPTIVTIVDKEKLKDNPFFEKALTGDKIIAYENNKRIFLYRPSLNKLVGVIPFVINEASASPTLTKAPKQ